ncbi:TPA: hypothetical protein MJA81_16955 [Klebsiella pneumoniae]|nr:hypothetical protein [Klebsiella pneumoniae]HBY9802019.1 hypothetical protein [Klebsiella pneumoniae]
MNTTLVLRLGYLFSRPASLWGTFTIVPEFSFMTAYRGPSLRHLRLSRHPLPQHTVCGNARKRNENHYHKSCANVSAQQ